MKYLVDILTAIAILVLVLFFIYKPTKELDRSSLVLKGLDGYPINITQESLILHISNVSCMTCKRDTQVLMRYHFRHPDIPIIDANILYTSSDREELIEWKKTTDLGYTIATIENPSAINYPVPTTLVFHQNKKTKIFGALTYEKLTEATDKSQ